MGSEMCIRDSFIAWAVEKPYERLVIRENYQVRVAVSEESAFVECDGDAKKFSFDRGIVRFGLRGEPPSSVYQSPPVFAALMPEVAFVLSVAFARDIV